MASGGEDVFVADPCPTGQAIGEEISSLWETGDWKEADRLIGPEVSIEKSHYRLRLVII